MDLIFFDPTDLDWIWTKEKNYGSGSGVCRIRSISRPLPSLFMMHFIQILTLFSISMMLALNEYAIFFWIYIHYLNGISWISREASC